VSNWALKLVAGNQLIVGAGETIPSLSDARPFGRLYQGQCLPKALTEKCSAPHLHVHIHLPQK
jgi:hypothetical protein